MDTFVDTLCTSIARAESSRGLDWRSSYSSVRVVGQRRVLVELSRKEVRTDLLASLGKVSCGEAPQGSVEIESSDGTVVELRLLQTTADRALWVTTSVADIRRDPAHTAELVNQCIMGETAEQLKRHGDWLLVRLPDGYHGWVCSWYVSEVARATIEEYEARLNVRVGSPVGYILSEPRAESIPVSDIVAGCRLVAGDTINGYREVILPIDKKGFIKEDDLEALQSGVWSRSHLVRTAYRFIGIPYQWGGTSAKAFDCSGLVRRVYQLEGVELPRDSDLQARVGSPLPHGEPTAARPGDLLFFGEGETIKHVAIFIGGGRFIHAYGCVRINSLREDDSLYEEKLARSLLFIRSVLGGA